MGDAIGSKNTCKTFSTEFFDYPVEKVEFIDWKCQSEFSVEKSWIEQALFRLRKKARFADLGFSRKRPFSTVKSDCIRNGLRQFITQSDSASRKRPFSTGFFWSFLSSVQSIL